VSKLEGKKSYNLNPTYSAEISI